MSNSVAPSPISSSGVKATQQSRPRHLGVLGEVRDRRHDLRDARLVVGAEQRVAARAHDVMADLRGKLGHPLGVEHRAPSRERDRLAVVGAVHDRLDARAGFLRARVDMRDQPDGRRVLADRRRQRGHDVAVVVELGVRQSRLDELVDQHPGELELARRTRRPLPVTTRLRVDTDVAQEAIEDVVGKLLGERRRVGGHRRRLNAVAPLAALVDGCRGGAAHENLAWHPVASRNDDRSVWAQAGRPGPFRLLSDSTVAGCVDVGKSALAFA